MERLMVYKPFVVRLRQVELQPSRKEKGEYKEAELRL
jgi:hypothetical protein